MFIQTEHMHAPFAHRTQLPKDYNPQKHYHNILEFRSKEAHDHTLAKHSTLCALSLLPRRNECWSILHQTQFKW